MRGRSLLSCARVLLCALAALARPVVAAPASVSYSTWIVSPGAVTLRLRLPAAGAARLTGSDIPVLTVQRLGAYLLGRTGVRSGGRDCPAIDQGYDLGKVDPLAVAPGLYGFEIMFRCPGPPGPLSLHDHVLFDRVPGHIDFARIERGGQSSLALFTAGREQLQVPDTGALPAAGIGRYLRLGALHLLGSPDRLCLLLGAMLLVRRRRDLGGLLLGLAAGYGLSLLAGVPDVMQPQPALTDAWVGFLVALLAVLLATRRFGGWNLLAAGLPAALAVLAVLAAARAPRCALLLAGAALLAFGLLAAAAPPGAGNGTGAGTGVGTGAGAGAGTGVGARAGAASARLLPVTMFGFLDGFTLPTMLAPMTLTGLAPLHLVAAYDLGSMLPAAVMAALFAGLAGMPPSVRIGLVPARHILDDCAAACLGGLGAFWLVSRLPL
ncbi:MAG TPA: hypothetical protein VMB48_00815 [Steroidobacteraceae bacterium]|nr:hypothetical protein [Steroidobacteraceae bacterium]